MGIILLRKIVFFTWWNFILYNFWFLLLIPEIYSILYYQLYLIIYFTLTFIETIIRPWPSKKTTHFDRYDAIMLLLFVVNPLLIVAAFYENKYIISNYLSFWDSLAISYIGLILLFLGASLTILGRYQLSEYGSGALEIRKDHKLITHGVLKYIRNPIYLGGLIGVIGNSMIFRCIFVMVISFIIYFMIFNERIKQEEVLLSNEFGQEYENYKKRTKRFIPFIY